MMNMRAFYWSVRRELWENRSVLIAPAASALLFLAGYLASGQARSELWLWCAMAQTIIPIVASLAGLFYALDALHGERRDRSILFWKSLPVSDLVTVLSKAAVPLVVLPAFTLAVLVVLQASMVAATCLMLLGADGGPSVILTTIPWGSMTVNLLHAFVLLPLWQAPLYGWLLLISGWAPRMVLLWAVLVPVAAGMIERAAFGSNWISSLLGNRLTFNVLGQGSVGEMSLGNSPMSWLMRQSASGLAVNADLWLGLAAAILLLAATVVSRRYRQPI